MNSYTKITLSYLAFGFIWVLVTDITTLELAPTIKIIAIIEVIKGWVYVFLSAWLIYYLTKQSLVRYRAVQEEKLKIYQTTIGGVHHILLNYLNQMQLVTMEAEKLSNFNREILAISNAISQEAVAALTRLGEIEKISVESIESVAYANVKNQEYSSQTQH